GRRLDVLLDAVHLLGNRLVFAVQAPELGAGELEVVDARLELGKLVGEIVMVLEVHAVFRALMLRRADAARARGPAPAWPGTQRAATGAPLAGMTARGQAPCARPQDG